MAESDAYPPASSGIDPQMKTILGAMLERRAERAPMAELSPPELRARAAADLAYWNQNPPPLPAIDDHAIPGAFGPTRIRVYHPVESESPLPALVYFHGGGWVIGDLETEDLKLRYLARHSHCAVISVDYVLAPEHKFPDPVDDCLAASRWIAQHGPELGIDPERLALGGASAGAHLALATAIRLRDAGENWLRALLLFYGVFSARTDTPSRHLFGNGDFGLTKEDMDFFLSRFLRHPSQKTEPLVSPLDADLAGLPPTILIAAELDPLRDDSRDLAARLQAADVLVTCREYAGVVHGFTLMIKALDVAGQAVREAGTALRNVLD